MLDEKNIGNDSSSLSNGNHFPSYIYISREISIEHPSVGLASLAQLGTPRKDTWPTWKEGVMMEHSLSPKSTPTYLMEYTHKD